MPIIASELVNYGAASRPEDDISTSGGAIDVAARPLDSQWSSNAVAAVVSDGADVRTVTITGRLATGLVDTEILTLNGAVEVVGGTTWERILNVVISVADAARTVTLRQGAAGSTRHTFNPNETDAFIMFPRSASEAVATTRYEKLFWRNLNATLTLQNASVTLTSDPSNKIKIAVTAVVDDTGSVANRETSPGLTFVDDGVIQNVPGGSLAAGSAIGVWVELALLADDAAQKSTFTTGDPSILDELGWWDMQGYVENDNPLVRAFSSTTRFRVVENLPVPA